MSASAVSQSPLARFGLVVLLLVGLFLSCFERAQLEASTGLRGEAARNRYLAAERLLGALGLPVTRVRQLSELAELPPPDATLIIPGRRFLLSAERSAELVDWTERGGHLVVVVWTIWDEPDREADPILDPLGVQQYLHAPAADDARDGSEASEPDAGEPDAGEGYRAQAQPQDPDGEPGQAEGPGSASGPDRPGVSDQPGDPDESSDPDRVGPPESPAALAEWVPEPGGEPLRARFDGQFFLKLAEGRSADLAIGDAAGTHVLSLPLGKGHVTVWTDDGFFTNDGIGRHDHAELAVRLVQRYPGSGATWIVTEDAASPSVASRFWRDAWSAGVALCVLLGFHLWSRGVRFGPVQPDPVLERRELMEHVEACGRFLMQHGGAAALLGAVRAALLRRVQSRHPQWLRLPASARTRQLAERTGQTQAEIEWALGAAQPPQSSAGERAPAEFRAEVAKLEAIRRKL